MGSARLKKKTELNYRRGTTSRYCEHCNHYVSSFPACTPDGKFRAFEPRCEIMGLQNGRAYRIHPANICDRHDNSRYLKRLRGY